MPRKLVEVTSFGAELFRVRVSLGLSQATVAGKAGVTAGYYSSLENSRRPPPPIGTVLRIANSLGIGGHGLRLLCSRAEAERSQHGTTAFELNVSPLAGTFILRNGQVVNVSPEKLARIEHILEEEEPGK
ncbi:helix-turn-helix domain-containing protein [Pseudoduganella sp.]|uniref:helix-turn-helix domain-containing protein n=1 Tax=Pseudoduganella sp. TaxID=1880898 RepID=UPI0035B0E36E